jgi:alanyl-tRNA synthetase
VADHLRAVTFLIYDGILPSNEGRGYVLRRLLRRATRQGTLFGKKEPFLFSGVPLVTQLMGSTASELAQRQQNIAHIIREEEERFLETIETGSAKLGELVETAKKAKKKTISGQEAFRLYDTFGFPPEVTKEILAETGMSFDDSEFSKAQNQAQDLAREGWKGSGAKDVTIYNELQKKVGPTQFVGYDTLVNTAPILAVLKDGKSVNVLKPGEKGEIITSSTPFYPEGGGQVGDKGWIKGAGSNQVLADVVDAQKPITNFVVHVVKVHKDLNVGDKVDFVVDKDHREPTKRHHTATHLLHAALRKILGTTVTQAGSLVEPERLRFDYTYNKPLTSEQIADVERLVNDAVLQNWKVTPKVFPAEEARKMGAMALFGEKYGNEVRCLLVSGKGFEDLSEAFSLELCGGTHVSASGDIGPFKIVSDTSLAAGVRRIEAVAGFKALEYFHNVESILSSVSDKLKSPAKEVDSRLTKILERQKQLEQEVRDLKLKLVQGGETTAAQPAVQVVRGINLAIKVTEGLEAKDLRTLADRLRDQIKSGVVFAASTVAEDGREKISFVFTVTPDMKAKGLDAGKLAKAAAAELGGSGGGRADFAQGGGEGNAKLQALVQKIPTLI